VTAQLINGAPLDCNDGPIASSEPSLRGDVWRDEEGIDEQFGDRAVVEYPNTGPPHQDSHAAHLLGPLQTGAQSFTVRTDRNGKAGYNGEFIDPLVGFVD
jgi:hypothetical protein